MSIATTPRTVKSELLGLVLEAMPSGIVVVDSAGTIVLVNRETERLFRCERRELLGQPVEILVPERFRENHPSLRDSYFANPQVRSMGAGRELYGLRRDGSEFPVEIGLNPIPTQDGIFILAAVVDITQRKRLEERFRATVESAPTAMVMVDSQGTIVLVNVETERLFHYGRHELVGQPVEVLVPERFRGEHPRLREEFLAHPQARRMGLGRELYGLRKDGSEFPIEIGLNPVETTEGLFVLSAIADISERKQLEERFRATVESAPMAMVMINEDGNIVLVNSETERLFRYGRHELLHQPVEVLLPERFRAKHPHLRDGFFANPQARTMGVGRELFGLRKDGSEFPVEIGLNPIQTQEGILVLGAVVDISERFRAAEKMSRAQRLAALNLAQDAEDARRRTKESEERLNLALNSSGVGTWNWDVVEKTIMWDDYLHPLFGMKPGTFRGTYKDFLRTLVSEERKRVTREVSSALEDNSVFDAEFQVVWPDGSVHVLSSRGKVYRDAAGRALRMTGVCWDVTERCRIQETVARQAQELARSNKELEQFAYIASHDLQEPLRKVQAFGDLLSTQSGDVLSDEGRDYLKRMQNAAHRMQGLINDLLNYSRVASQAKPFVSVDLAEVAHEVVSDLEARIVSTKGTVEIGELPTIVSDPLQMRQLLQNLIGNALKFHQPEVPPVVIVQSRSIEAGEDASMPNSLGNEWCEITVQDNGIGFEEKYLDRIFAPFQRLHGRGEYEGTGIGLAICRKIVERHGGTITARSTPGSGTTFIVTLPLRHPSGESSHV